MKLYMILKDDYVKVLIPELYLFLAEKKVSYDIFEKINKEKFIEYASKKEV